MIAKTTNVDKLALMRASKMKKYTISLLLVINRNEFEFSSLILEYV